MNDFKSKLPSLEEVTHFAGKLFRDIKTSVNEIIVDYKQKRTQAEEVDRAANPSATPTAEPVKKTHTQETIITPPATTSAPTPPLNPSSETVTKPEPIAVARPPKPRAKKPATKTVKSKTSKKVDGSLPETSTDINENDHDSHQ